MQFDEANNVGIDSDIVVRQCQLTEDTDSEARLEKVNDIFSRQKESEYTPIVSFIFHL